VGEQADMVLVELVVAHDGSPPRSRWPSKVLRGSTGAHKGLRVF